MHHQLKRTNTIQTHRMVQEAPVDAGDFADWLAQTLREFMLGHEALHRFVEREPLYRVHAGFAADLEFARQTCARATGYRIGTADDVPHVFVEF